MVEAAAGQCEAPTSVKAFLYEQRRANVVAIFGDEADDDHQALIDYFAGEAPPLPPPIAKVAKIEDPITVIERRWETVTRDNLQVLYDQGRSSQEIGKLYGVSKVKVLQLANAHGIDRSAQLRRT